MVAPVSQPLRQTHCQWYDRTNLTSLHSARQSLYHAQIGFLNGSRIRGGAFQQRNIIITSPHGKVSTAN